MSVSIEHARRDIRQTNPNNTKEINIVANELVSAFEIKDTRTKAIAKQGKTIRKKLGVNHLQYHIESRDEHHITSWLGGALTGNGYRRP